jgi:hypothetical protein
VAVPLNAFGPSLSEGRPRSSSRRSLSRLEAERIRRRSGLRRFSEERLKFDPEPRECSVTAVDESAAKRGVGGW